MYENYYAVIMAGGGGTRLWPLSRKSRPKQMLSIGQDRSLFQVAVDRLQGVFSSDRIYVVTVEEQAAGLQKQCPEIPVENFLQETMPKGTASVVGYAAAILVKRDPNAVMAVLTADHIIGNLKLFQQILTSAYQVASEDYLVTLGVTPTYPATGYGYTRRGELVGRYQDLDVFQVQEFTEKPTLPEAERMFSSGEYAWNSGMFFWRAEVILNEISRQMSELSSQLEIIAEAWGTPAQDNVIRKVWPDIKPETIDFGIMENADKVAVIPAAGLEWNDVGSWEAIFDVLPADEDGNISRGGEHISLDTSGTLIFTADNPRTVVTIGARDLIVVDTGDILLICDRGRTQEVRQIVKRLENEGRFELL
jgi:mannose-1-phosphate guanylyltransferase